MKKTKIDPSQALFKVADAQMGHFTSQQAERAGISNKNHAYHVKAGHWKRVMRGIYRLSNYPLSDNEELMVWFLWSKNREDIPQGVFSHETALDIYNLTDINPPHIHMIVPREFKRLNPIPKVIKLHRNILKNSEIKSYHGMKITTPLRTLQDLAKKGSLSPEFLSQAVNEAVRSGLVKKSQISKNSKLSCYLDKK